MECGQKHDEKKKGIQKPSQPLRSSRQERKADHDQRLANENKKGKYDRIIDGRMDRMAALEFSWIDRGIFFVGGDFITYMHERSFMIPLGPGL